MPIAIDAVSSAAFSTDVSTKSWSHTNTTVVDMLIGVSYHSTGSSNTDSTNVTVSGSTATLVARSRNQTGPGRVVGAELWRFLNATSGAKTVEVTLNNSSLTHGCGVMAAGFSGSTGVESTAVSTGNSSAAINLTVPVATLNAMPFGVCGRNSSINVTTGTGAVILANTSGTGNLAAFVRRDAGSSGNQTLSLNSLGAAGWAWAGAAVVPIAVSTVIALVAALATDGTLTASAWRTRSFVATPATDGTLAATAFRTRSFVAQPATDGVNTAIGKRLRSGNDSQLSGSRGTVTARFMYEADTSNFEGSLVERGAGLLSSVRIDDGSSGVCNQGSSGFQQSTGAYSVITGELPSSFTWKVEASV